jgi:hypothetical protein
MLYIQEFALHVLWSMLGNCEPVLAGVNRRNSARALRKCLPNI